jgi:hypothetical protein
MTTRISREDDAIVRENAPGWVRFNYQLRIVAVPKLPITILVSTHDMRLVQELFPRTIVMDE